jgi:AcrR family transcriptional regulator
MAADRRQKIIQAAVKSFIEKGAAFSKLSEVAKSARVPAPLIHYYFPTLEDLHFEVIQYAIQDITEYSVKFMKEGSTPVEGLRQYIRAPLQWIQEKPGLASIIVYFYYLASCSPRFLELNTFARNRGRERIEMMIYKGLEQKAFRLAAGKTAADAAYEIQAIISGYSLQFSTERREQKLEYYLDRACQSVFVILGISR